jgi:hypothetical protein
VLAATPGKRYDVGNVSPIYGRIAFPEACSGGEENIYRNA